MNEYVRRQNSSFLKEWISLNPNFKNIHYSNNIITFENGTSINIDNFLISNLLENNLIRDGIYSMDEYLFYKILYVNVEIVNKMKKSNSDEYIKNIQINSYGYAVIISNKRTIEIKDIKALQVLAVYNNLINSNVNNYYVPVKDLFIKLNKREFIEESNNISFFDLIDLDNPNLTDYNYIKTFSKYMYDLMCYQDYLVGEAKDVFELYKYTINKLLNTTQLTENQKITVNTYKDYLNAYYLKNQKEAISSRKASTGSSSLVLIIISVIVTLAFITLLIIIN